MVLSIENSPTGVLAVANGAWSHRETEYVKSKSITKLELNYAKGWYGDSLKFLEDLPLLSQLTIIDRNIKSIDQIQSLSNLQVLKLFTASKTKLDFSHFRSLRECSLEWNSGLASIFGATNLKRLYLYRFPDPTSEPFSSLKQLEVLDIKNSQLREIESFKWLLHLRHLGLSLLPKLLSLKGVNELFSLAELSIDTCKQLSTIEDLKDLKNLKQLSISNCGDISSLRPLDEIKGLEKVLFIEDTNIVDGDLTPLLSLSHLKLVAFVDRRHYNLRREQINLVP